MNLTFDVNIRNDSEKFRIVLKGSDGTYYWSPIFDPTNTIVDNNISHFSNFIQGQEPIYPRDANLIALWRMNDKNSSGWILNSKTGVRDGNLIGGADVNASGLWDKNALNLNGSGSYVKVNSLSSNASNGFTWGVWIKADTLSGSFVLDQRESNVGFQPLYIGSGANYGDIQFYSSNTGSTTYFNTNLQTGLWYHIALVVNSSNSTVSCYINGAFVESKGDTAYNFGLKNLYIGSRHSKASYFDGLIDEVAIWNTALSADEIKEIYSIGSGVHDFNTQADGNGLYLKTIGSTNVSDGNFYSRVFDFNGMVDFNSLSFTKINIGSTFSSVFQKDNNLNSNSSLASSVLKRTDNNAFTATGEMDWNTLANYTFNSTDFNRDMNGLVAYYKLNDKNSGGYVLNSATGVRDGLLNSGADVNVLGLWDTNAGWFNGSTGYVSVPYNLNLAPTNISVSSWFYVLNNSIDQRVISKTESGGYQISFNENNACGASKFCFLVNVGGTYYPTTVPATSIRSNVWTNTVGTYDGETVRLYVNGVLVDSNTSPSGNLTYTQNNPLCIGSEATASACSGSGIYFGGQIDELKIYDRSLSATEILSDYNRFLNAKFVDSNIIDATFTADWNLIKINSDINYNFGKEISSKEKFFDSNLIGLWHLNDKNSQGWVLNSVSGVRDGNLIGGADVNGVGLWDTNAGYFDGVNDYVSAGDIDLIDGVTELTVSTWVKINNVSKDNDIIAKGIHNTNVPLLFWRDDVVGGGSQIGNSKCVSVQVYDGDTSSWTSSPSGSLNDTTWHHVLFTFKANVLSGLKIYVDGVNVNSASTVNVNLIQSSASIVTIGAPTSGGPTNNFSGLMEEVAIWNRALSATEVSDLYRKGISRLDLNVYSCSDSSCTTKTGSQYISDANNNSAMDLNSNVLNSRYLGFDAFFKKAKGFEDYNAGTFYVGSFIKDVNVLYQNNLMSLFGRVSVNGLTWLDWNTLSDASLQSLNIPDGNFFQYKAVLSSASNASSPVLRDLNVTYRRIDN